MPRRARVIVPGLPHHIVQRGHNRDVVFVEDRDYEYYLDNLAEWKAFFGLQVYSYCLMTNHVHLIVGANDCSGDFDFFMKWLAGLYFVSILSVKEKVRVKLNIKSFVWINISPYLVFAFIGVAYNLLESKFGSEVGGFIAQFLWVYWIFPVLIIAFSMLVVDKRSKIVRFIRGLLLAFLFLASGVVMMYGFLYFRIWLGVSI